MAAPQPRQPNQTNQTNQPQTKPVSRSLPRALRWPLVAAGLGALLIHNSMESRADLKPQTPPPVVAPATPRATASAADPALPRSVPERISIPQIGVNAPFTGLSIGASGQLNPPPADDTNLVGWFRDGASPGERGSSIVVGHVDTKTGPAVFARLEELRSGSTVRITRADGIVASFKVDSVKSFSKADFPNKRVYADASSPELRLITCGGAYNKSTREYEENVVVFAHLVAARRT
ncbi:class F sortase [Streptomyces acidicola]|uniref:Class F sortase n=1 Tax=Streptomyces acidicola TaxID=2596892 RepID=A0A5N8WIP2_9ACTN|nr:class F sortase [Streptomyces acidicola]MPY47350.1 class F sortase [Streptomyces acidicola]